MGNNVIKARQTLQDLSALMNNNEALRNQIREFFGEFCDCDIVEWVIQRINGVVDGAPTPLDTQVYNKIKELIAPPPKYQFTRAVNHPPQGMLLNRYCQGKELWGTYGDGNGGTYTSKINRDHKNCDQPFITMSNVSLPTQSRWTSLNDLLTESTFQTLNFNGLDDITFDIQSNTWVANFTTVGTDMSKRDQILLAFKLHSDFPLDDVEIRVMAGSVITRILSGVGTRTIEAHTREQLEDLSDPVFSRLTGKHLLSFREGSSTFWRDWEERVDVDPTASMPFMQIEQGNVFNQTGFSGNVRPGNVRFDPDTGKFLVRLITTDYGVSIKTKLGVTIQAVRDGVPICKYYISLNYNPSVVTWVIRSTIYQSWKAIAYGNNTFVGVGSSYPSTLMKSLVSTNSGTTWTEHVMSDESGTARQVKAVCFGNGLFVAVGVDGYVQTSSDGVNWTVRPAFSPGLYSYWTGVVYGNGRFVAVGNGDYTYYMYSLDGITWVKPDVMSVGYSLAAENVCFGNGLFVATSDSISNGLATSTDGTFWTQRTFGGGSVGDVCFGNGMFAGIGSTFVIRSTDGINWTRHTVPNYAWNSIAYGDGKYIACAGSVVYVSTDGLTWTTENIGSNGWTDIIYAAGKFVTIGNNNSGSGNVATREVT